MNYEIGSMWNRWDLHIHTPNSILNNQFGENFNEYFYDLFTKAIKNGIKVIGITDYFSIEGYKKIINYLKDDQQLKEIFSSEINSDENYLQKVKEITIFPNIELRLTNTVNYINKQKQCKLELHVIFSNELSTENIETLFLHQIHFKDGSTDYPLTLGNIKSFGERMINSGICNKNDSDPIYVGYNQIAVEINEVAKVIEKDYFKGKALIIGVGEDISNISWQDQAGGLRKNYYKICNAVFASNVKDISWFASNDSIETIGSQKSCLWGSDAHSISDLFEPDKKRYCWIKADTTFTGLKSAINLINERIFIGEYPIELIEATKRANYSIGSIYIGQNSTKSLEKKWFTMNNEILLNPFMVTIIGNKGSGKSALADVIAYLGNSYKIDKASFLNEQRFLNPITKYNLDFEAYMCMNGNDKVSIHKNNLGNDYSIDNYEKVKFLPQKYIEEVCNGLGYEFQEEIDDVIYSYISPEKKLNSSNLKDLIEKVTKSTRENIFNKRKELDLLNEKIVSLEDKNTYFYRQKIKNQLAIQENRLRSHDLNKPKEVSKPSDIDNNFYAKLDYDLSKYLEIIKNKISEVQVKQNSIEDSLKIISQFDNSVNGIIAIIKSCNNEYSFIKEKLEIDDSRDYILYNVNYTALINRKNELLRTYSEFSSMLNEQFDSKDIMSQIVENFNLDIITEKCSQFKSLYERKYYIECYKKKLHDFTTDKEKKYLEYIENINQWTYIRKMYTGEIPNTLDGDSVKKYKDELDYIEAHLLDDIIENKEKRKTVIKEICELYKDLKNSYIEIYSPVQKKIDSLINNGEDKIEFRVNTYPYKDLSNKLIGNINQRINSPFKGVVEGLEHIKKHIRETDFDNASSIVEFTTKMYDDISEVADLNQLIKGRKEYYDYIGGLEYLNVNYTLTLGGKKLQELSPGERGIVLLVFYLALSKSNFPLIIDQPEDNLDNQSIYKRLVPCIKAAKKNRQIIVVTHNPNIAVACDSEQIIYTHMNKENYEITYLLGSLENPAIKEKVVDILEGTMPAFEMRKLKYFDEIKV